MEKKEWIIAGIIIALAVVSLYWGFSTPTPPPQAQGHLGYINNTTANLGRDYPQYVLSGHAR